MTALGPESDRIVVTYTPFPDGGTFDFTNPDGEAVLPPVDVQDTSESLAGVVDDLTDLTLHLQSGEFTVAQVAEAVDRGTIDVSVRMLPRVTAILPPEIVSFERRDAGTMTTLRLGNIAIASRRPSEAEVTARREAREAQERAAYERHRNEVLAADEAKLQLLAYDRAHVTAGIHQDRFVLELGSSEAMVATRVLQHLEPLIHAGNPQLLSDDKMAEAVWEAMPIAERALFTSDETAIFGTGDEIRDIVHGVFAGLTNRLGLTTTYGPTEYQLLRSRLEVTLSETSEEAQDGARARSIYLQTTAEATEPIVMPSERDTTVARSAMSLLLEPVPLTHDEAVPLLNVLMTLGGREAVRLALADATIEMDPSEARLRLHALVRESLGSFAYYTAVASNTIPRVDRGPRHVAERLEGDTLNLATARRDPGCSGWRIGPARP